MNKYAANITGLVLTIKDASVKMTERSTDWREQRQAGSLYENVKVVDVAGNEYGYGLHELAESLLPASPRPIDGVWTEEVEADFDLWIKARNSIIRKVQREVLKVAKPDIAKAPWVPTCGNSGKGCCCSPHFILRASEYRGRSAWIEGTVVVTKAAPQKEA